MARAHVELDFFGLQNDSSSSAVAATAGGSLPQPRLDRRRSFRGISKINPEIVKSVIASAGKTPATPTPNLFPELPVFHPHPLFRTEKSEKAPETAQMTIFYKGAVSVFDLPTDKAEFIMKVAMEKSNTNNAKNEGEVDQSCFNNKSEEILEALNDGDLPIKRKKSLQRFFEKRKERLISVSPYHIHHVFQKTSA